MGRTPKLRDDLNRVMDLKNNFLSMNTELHLTTAFCTYEHKG